MRCPLYPPNVKDKPLGRGTRDLVADWLRELTSCLIRLRLQAMRVCLAIRQRIQDECFVGQPDPVHQEAMDFLQNGINHCLALEAVNCAPGHPMVDLRGP
jgi:hypothetical protein